MAKEILHRNRASTKIICSLGVVFFLSFFLKAGEAVLIVSQKAASSVAFYSLQGQLFDTVSVGKHPHEIVLSTDGHYLYVADNGTMSIEQAGQGNNTVSIVDVAERRRVRTVSLGRFHRPHGIDVNPKTGHVLVSTENPDQLIVIDPKSGNVLRRYDTRGQTSHIVTVDHEGRWAYVSNSRSGNVSAVELETGKVTLIPSGDRPEGSVLSEDGKRLYVVNRDSDSIAIIDTAHKKKVGQIQTGDAPVRIVLSPDGQYLIYALHGDRAVGFADVSARREVNVVELDGGPVSMNLSADGEWALTAAQDQDTVYLISVPEQKLLRQFKVVSGAGPDPAVMVVD